MMYFKLMIKKLNFKLFLKVFISIAIIALLLDSIDYNTLMLEFSSIKIKYIIFSFILILLIRFVMALRWKILLTSFNIHTSYLQLVSIIFISNSVGHILPGGIGTDIIRSYHLASKEGMAEKIAASVFIDRIFGFTSMLILAQLASIYASIGYNISVLIPLFVSGSLLSLFILYLIGKRVSKREISSIHKIKLLEIVFSFYNKVIASLKELNMSQTVIYKSFILSLTVQIVRCFVFYLIFKSLNIDTSILYFLVFIPIVFIVILLPISIGGLGVREASLFAFFGQFGIQLSTCTLAGLLFHTLQIIALIPGLLMFLKKR